MTVLYKRTDLEFDQKSITSWADPQWHMREEEGFQFVEVAVSGEGEYIFKMKGGTFTGEDRAARTVSEKNTHGTYCHSCVLGS